MLVLFFTSLPLSHAVSLSTVIINLVKSSSSCPPSLSHSASNSRSLNLCSPSAGEGWRCAFRVWCQVRLAHKPDPNHLIMSPHLSMSLGTEERTARGVKLKEGSLKAPAESDRNLKTNTECVTLCEYVLYYHILLFTLVEPTLLPISTKQSPQSVRPQSSSSPPPASRLQGLMS